jgi:penicillin-binding protein 1A
MLLVLRLFLSLIAFLLLLFIVFAGGAAWFVSELYPKLPDVEVLRNVQMQEPLRIYASGGELIAEFGEVKRIPLSLCQPATTVEQDCIPPMMVNAILAAEDNRFFEHPGIDIVGLARAGVALIRTGEKSQGGSTITMQLARNFFLSPEKSYLRKVNEILLAYKLEKLFSKQTILELYLNKIYLGKRAYGVGAAAQIYYGKRLRDLNIAQLATIAALPKAPSAFNPINDPERAQIRRNYILHRMQELAMIDASQLTSALRTPIATQLNSVQSELEAPYIAEMVRSQLFEQYGNMIYEQGLAVVTTIDASLQRAATRHLRHHLQLYERRHGWRGAEAQHDLTRIDTREGWLALLARIPTWGGLKPVLVTGLEAQQAAVIDQEGRSILLDWQAMSWARRHIDENRLGPEPKVASDILKIGDIVRVAYDRENDRWDLVQLPAIAGALVALRPGDGSVVALEGGFDFFHSKFNRVTQAERQTGSIFKPFIYSAALEKGYNAASVINDAPVVFEDDKLESAWRPENYSGRIFGPTRLREALFHSRNLVSIRLLRAIGINYSTQFVSSNFGFDRRKLPTDLSLALGSGTMTPWELVRGYAVFANGGFLIDPYLIQSISNQRGEQILLAKPAIACSTCELAIAQGQRVDLRLAPRTLSPRNAWLMHDMLRDVVTQGTGRRALKLNRSDIAGKTGTTNEQRDAWFAGYSPMVASVVWLGFDSPKPMGSREAGGFAALPLWIDFMADALANQSEYPPQQPIGIGSALIDADTGEFTGANNPKARFEHFYVEQIPTTPPPAATPSANTQPGGATAAPSATDDLF